MPYLPKNWAIVGEVGIWLIKCQLHLVLCCNPIPSRKILGILHIEFNLQSEVIWLLGHFLQLIDALQVVEELDNSFHLSLEPLPLVRENPPLSSSFLPPSPPLPFSLSDSPPSWVVLHGSYHQDNGMDSNRKNWRHLSVLSKPNYWYTRRNCFQLIRYNFCFDHFKHFYSPTCWQCDTTLVTWSEYPNVYPYSLSHDAHVSN